MIELGDTASIFVSEKKRIGFIAISERIGDFNYVMTFYGVNGKGIVTCNERSMSKTYKPVRILMIERYFPYDGLYRYKGTIDIV